MALKIESKQMLPRPLKMSWSVCTSTKPMKAKSENFVNRQKRSKLINNSKNTNEGFISKPFIFMDFLIFAKTKFANMQICYKIKKKVGMSSVSLSIFSVTKSTVLHA